MQERWKKHIKRKLFRLIKAKGLDITKISVETGHEASWLSQQKIGRRKRLDYDLDVIPVLEHLGVDPKRFMAEVIRDVNNDEMKDVFINQLEITYD